MGRDAAEASARRVGEREISMYECVARPIGALFHREAAVAKCELVAKFRQNVPCVLGGIWLRHAVMQMNLDLAPTSMTVIGEHLEQAFIVLLSGIEVGMDERPAIVVSPAIYRLWIFAAPTFQAAFLLGA